MNRLVGRLGVTAKVNGLGAVAIRRRTEDKTRSFTVAARFCNSFLVIALLALPASPAKAALRVERDSVAIQSPLRPAGGPADGIVTHLRLDRTLYEQLKSVERVTLSGFALAADRKVDLELKRVEVFTEDARIVLSTPEGKVELPKPDVVLLSGQVRDHPDSMAFLSLSPSGNNGLIQLDGQIYVLSSGRRPRQLDAVIYNLSTLPPGAINWLNWTCGTDLIQGRGGFIPPHGATPEPSSGSAGSVAGVPLRMATVAVETDWEYTANVFGGDTAAASAYAATLIGAASEIYARDVDTGLQIGFLNLWTDPSDPWTQGDTIDQLYEFQDYWNAFMTGVERNVVHFLSGRPLGGGVAYLGGLCDTGWDYGLSANINGYFPYPLQDNHGQNWDIMVFSHEMGHNFGAPHTHNMSPPIDGCAWGDCSVTPNGTIMSYCHTCPGGLANIVLRFHDRIINEEILPFLNFQVGCDLTWDPGACAAVDPPSQGALGATNRFLSIVGANPGRQTAIRVTIASVPPPYDYLNGTVMWVGAPQEISEHSGTVNPDEAPEFDKFWAATLVCDQTQAYLADWTTYGTVHVYHAGIIPNGNYAVQEIYDTCDFAEESNYSFPRTFVTSRWGDLVEDCTTNPCGPPDGSVDVVTDVVALVDKFVNLAGAPVKARCDLEPEVPDLMVNITDVSYAIDAFQGADYSLAGPSPCP